MPPLILNQYRSGSSYKDVVGAVYHFPARYRSRFGSLPSPFVYYEPREGGEQVYFGAGWVVSIDEDTEDAAHYYADLDRYRPFASPVSYFAGPGGESWEPAKTMRNSVRQVSQELFDGILLAGGLRPDPNTPPAGGGSFYAEHLEQELRSLQSGRANYPSKLRKVQRILELYERPSSVTNWVKRTRGDTCQLCGQRGFVKRDGGRYCEVHHLFHLADDPPPDCLRPEYVVVLCPNCHRRMHYAEVAKPVRASGGWAVRIDGQDHLFPTDPPPDAGA
jgi:hypothetical protein